MRIGLCSSEFKVPLDCETYFKKLAEMNFPVTQLGFMSLTEFGFTPTGSIEIPGHVDDSVIDKIKNAANKYGVEIAACNGTFNMAHPDPAIREEAIARFEGFTAAVTKFGAKFITLCSGTRNPDHLWSPHPDNETQSAWDDMFDSMKRITKIAEKYGRVLAIETEAANVINTPEKARKIMDDLGSPNLKMIIDCANLFHVGKAHKENVRATLKKAFEYFGNDIVVAHGKDISDSNGIDYCPTGEGIIDYEYFVELLKEYGYQGDMLLHSIYDEEKMVVGRDLIKRYV